MGPIREEVRAASALAVIVMVTSAATGAGAAQDGPTLLTGLSSIGAIDTSGADGQLAQADSPASQPSDPPARAAGGLTLGDINVIAKQLDIARQSIEPSLGASVYRFNRQAIETQPQGENQPLNRLLLQAPGVTQDSFGQIHVRGDHANLQFRLNGFILPEGINVFGQVLQTRL
ncbi:MAG TPA: TonB-dependent receptor, partial [Stellaceae bacterium]